MSDYVLHGDYVQHNQHALALHRSRALYKIVVCGRQSGKTHSGAEDFVDRVLVRDLPRLASKPWKEGANLGALQWRRRPRAHYWVVAPTYRLTNETLRALLGAIPPELVQHFDGSNLSLWLRGGVLIEFKSADNWKDLVSVALDGLWMEEAALLHPEAWKGRLAPTLASKGGWLLVTTTPLGQNWLYDELAKPAMDGHADMSFHAWRTVDNAVNVPALLATVERQRQLLPAPYFRREYEASFEAFLGQVYAEWSSDFEADPPPGIQFARILGGADWGFANPGALVVVGISADGTCYVLDEVYDRQLLVEDFWVPAARDLQSKWKFAEWVADPAEPDQLQRFSRAGLRVSGHRNYGSGRFDEHSRSVLSGIRQVASLIHQRKLRVSPTCKNVLREIKSYVWEQRPQGGTLETPARGQSDHAITALRYAVTYAMKPGPMRAL